MIWSAVTKFCLAMWILLLTNSLNYMSTTRGHPYKLYKHYTSSNIRAYFLLTQLSVCGIQLPPTVDFSSISTFKRTLQKTSLTELKYPTAHFQHPWYSVLSVVFIFAFNTVSRMLPLYFIHILWIAVRADFICLSRPASHLLFCCILFYWQINMTDLIWSQAWTGSCLLGHKTTVNQENQKVFLEKSEWQGTNTNYCDILVLLPYDGYTWARLVEKVKLYIFNATT